MTYLPPFAIRADGVEKLLRGAFLLQVARGPRLQHPARVVLLRVHAQHEHAGPVPRGLQRLEDIQAVHVGKGDVQDDDVDVMSRHPFQESRAASHLHVDLDIRLLQENPLQTLAEYRVVVAQGDSRHGALDCIRGRWIGQSRGNLPQPRLQEHGDAVFHVGGPRV